MRKVGLDLGNWNVKAFSFTATNPIRLCIASSIAGNFADRNGGKVKTLGSNTYRISSDKFGERLVGDSAAMQSNTLFGSMSDARWEQADALLPLVYVALAKISMGTDETHYQLATGLPLNHFDAYADATLKILRGDHKYTFNGKDMWCHIEVAPVNKGVLKCTLATWAEFVKLDVDGNINGDYNRIGFVDIGGGTTDLTVIAPDSDGDPTMLHDSSKSYKIGFSTVTKKLMEKLSLDGIDTNHWELERLIRNGKTTFGQVNFERWLQDAVEEVSDSIKDKMTELWNNGRDLDRIVICGGPANTLAPKIINKYGATNVTVLDDPLFATARGYARMAEFYGKT